MQWFEPPDIEKQKAKQDVKGLIKALKNQRVRRKAIEALGQLGDPRAVEALLQLLTDPNCADDWDQTVIALGQLRDTRAVAPLIGLVNDSNARWLVQKRAIKALAQLGDKGAVEPLITLFEDKRPREGELELRREAAEALGELGDARAVGPLLAALGDRDVRRRAVRVLGQFKDVRAVEPLILLLEDRTFYDEVAEALGQIGDARARDALSGILQPILLSQDEKLDAIERVVTALEKLGGRPDPAQTVGLAFRRDQLQQVLAFEAEAALPLIDFLETGWLKAIELLAQLNDDRVVPALTTALGSPSPGVPLAAAQALRKMTLTVNDLQRALLAIDENQWETVLRLGSVSVEPLLPYLKHKDQSMRKKAVETLGRLGDPRAIRPLVGCLNYVDWGVRHAVVEALSQLNWKPGDTSEEVTLAVATGDWPAAERFGAAALWPLYLATGDRERAERAVQTLERILKTMAQEAALKDLQALSNLKDVTSLEISVENWRGSDEVRRTNKTLDCASLRQLARQELIRRGELQSEAGRQL